MSARPNDFFSLLLGGTGFRLPETAGDLRRLIDGFAGLLNAGLPEVGALHPAVAVTEGVTADVVVPKGEGPHPVLVYLHGGGWVSGSPATHRKLAHRFAEAGFLVVSVDYRLAPEYPFPVPFEDCLAGVRWAAAQAERYGGDPSRLAVGGDSAGGNLSAAVAAALHGEPAHPKALLLLYGVFDFATLGAETARAPTLPGLEPELAERLLELMVGSYLGRERSGSLLRDPRVSPIHAAGRLPPTHVVVGSADPLLAQAEALVAELAAAGVPHEHHVDPGMPHGYAQLEFLAPARPAVERMIDFLRRTL